MSETTQSAATGLAVIRNPLKKTQLLAFYTSGEKHVGLDPYTDTISPEDDRGDNGEGSHDADPSGDIPKPGKLLRVPGDMVAFIYKSLITVTGIRVDNKIAIVSPYMKVLKGKNPPMTKTSALAGCSDETNKAWLFYLNTEDPPKLSQYMLGEGVSTDALGNLPGVDPQTKLCAAYNPKTKIRYCFYQNKSPKQISYIQITSNNTTSLGNVTGTGDIAPKTSITVVVLDDGALCLYWLNSAGQLNRNIYRNQDWGATTVITAAPPGTISQGLQLAATVGKDVDSGKTYVTIWQANTDSEGVRRVIDEIF